MKNSIQQGDKVRVKQYGGSLGDTLYHVKSVDGFHCEIQEIKNDGGLYSPQNFDTSLLKKVS